MKTLVPILLALLAVNSAEAQQFYRTKPPVVYQFQTVPAAAPVQPPKPEAKTETPKPAEAKPTSPKEESKAETTKPDPHASEPPATIPTEEPKETAIPTDSQVIGGNNVPEIATWEIQRRGNMVQDVGTVQAGPTDFIADALAVPEDDSHKWFITLVTKEGDKACDKLRYDFATSPVLRAWVNVDDPAKSPSHWQLRRMEDGTQKDWLAGLQGHIQKHGLPLVVIQPPRNGQYGANKNVVKLISGYDGDAAALSKKMRDGVIVYVSYLQRRGQLEHKGENTQRELATKTPRTGGHEQAEKKPATKPTGKGIGQTGVNPPFTVTPTTPPGPVDWPPTGPSQLTVAQLQALCPNAPPEFILQQYQAKATDPNAVSLAWMVYQNSNKPKEPKPEPPPVVEPKPDPTPVPVVIPKDSTPWGWILGLLGTGVGLQLLLTIVKLWEQSAALTPSKIDDIVSRIARQFLEGKVNQLPPPNPNQANPNVK